MSDNITSNYLTNRKAREAKERESMLAELNQMVAEEESAKAAPQAQPQAQPQGQPKESSKMGVGGAVRDAASAIAYAGTGAYDSAVNMVYDAVDAASTYLFNERFLGRSDLTGMLENTGFQKPQTVGGQVGKELVQWATPFTATLKAANAVQGATSAGAKIANATGAGAAADLTTLTDNLSRMMVDLGDKYPWMRNKITEALATDPNAPDYEKRLSNLTEGGLLGASFEGAAALVKMLRAANATIRAKGKDPVKELQIATEKAAQEQAVTMETKTVEKMVEEKTPIQKQIETVTGVREQKANWQKRLDVNAAVKAADAPKTLEQKNDAIIKATMDQHEATFAKGEPSHAVYVDPQTNTIVLSKEAPEAGHVNLGQEVNALLRPGTTAERNQAIIDATMGKPGGTAAERNQVIIKGTPASEGKGLTHAESNQRVIDDTMRQYLETYKKMQEDVLSRVEASVRSIKPAAEEAPEAGSKLDALWEVGDSVTYKGGAESGEVIRKGKNGTVVIKDDRTGKTMTVTPDADDPLVAEVKANDKELKRIGGRKNQGGFIDPSVLAHLAAAQLGGVAGYMSSPDDATMADKLVMAGMGALGGMGIARVGMSKMKSAEEADALRESMKAVEDMTRPEVANIAPKAPNAKKVPVITKEKVDKLVAIAKEGDFDKLADAAKAADFNFDNIDTADDVKQMIDGFSGVFEKEIDLAKHGVQSHRQLQELADEIGAGSKSLKELYGDTNNLGARIFAHRALLTASAEKVTLLAKTVSQGALTPAERDMAILSLRKQVSLHASIQAQMKGVQTEVARALSQFRLTSTSVDLAINERNALIEAMGGHKANLDFAEKLSQITDPKKLAAVTRKGAMARTQDALYEAWVNGLLSSPVTHAVNFMGNSLVAIGSAAEKINAALIGKVLRNPEAVDAGEAKAHLFGMMEGIKDTIKISAAGVDALRQATGSALKGDFKGAAEVIRENADEFGTTWQAAGQDMPILDNAAYGTREFDKQAPAISSSSLVPTQGAASDMLDASGMRKQVEVFTDVLGGVIRTPGRMLTASDELFKTAHYRGELKAQAYRIARGEGLSGDAFVKRVAQLVEDPTPELRAQALSAARTGTFTSPLGKNASSFANWVHNTPGAKYIVPFMRTPINIMKYVGVRTPGLNLAAKSVRDEFMAGGVRRDMMLAKTATGGMLYATGGYLAAQGYIVGGGEKNREAEKLGGKQQYSVKIGDTYYAFNRLDPFGMFLGLAADLSDMSGMLDNGTMEDVASAATLAVSRNLISKSYLQGIVKLIEVIDSQDEKKWSRWMRDFGASFVPAAVNQARKEADPLVREVWTFADAVKNRIPGKSSELYPHVNIFGEDVKYSGGLGVDMISPIRTMDANTDIAATEIARLNLDLRPPQKSISGGEGAPRIDLTPKQYYRMMKLMGEGFKPAVTEWVQSRDYKELPEDPSNNTYLNAKETSIKMMYDKYKQAAVAQLLAEDPDLMARYMQSNQNRANSFLGLPIVPIEQ